MNQYNKGKLLTPATASIHYGIKRSKIYNWIRNKRFKYIKPEKEILFWESDFLDFLNSYTIEVGINE